MTDYPTPWVFVIMVLASARLVHLLLWDSLIGTHPDANTELADRIQRFGWNPDRSPRSWWRAKLATLVTCPWCSGFWISLATVCVASSMWPWSLGHVGWITVGAVWAAQCVASALDYRFLVD
jgi:hypothetical protein